MKSRASRKQMIRYRFKDRMGCVCYQSFHTDREARLWFDRNKVNYALKELSSMGIIYPGNNVTRSAYSPINL